MNIHLFDRIIDFIQQLFIIFSDNRIKMLQSNRLQQFFIFHLSKIAGKCRIDAAVLQCVCKLTGIFVFSDSIRKPLFFCKLCKRRILTAPPDHACRHSLIGPIIAALQLIVPRFCRKNGAIPANRNRKCKICLPLLCFSCRSHHIDRSRL